MKVVQNLIAQNQLGVENIKEVLTKALSISEKIYNLVQKFSFEDLFQLGMLLAEFNALKALFLKAIAEFKDLTPAESEIVIEHLKANFDIKNDEIEERIEAILSLLPEAYELVVVNIRFSGKVIQLFKNWKKAA